MGKNKKNKVNPIAPVVAETPVAAPVVVAPVAGLTQDEETKLSELQTQIEQLKAAKIERERLATEKLINDLNALPAQFNQPDMDSMIALLRKHKRGGIKSESAPRKSTRGAHKIPDDIRAKVEADLKADKDTVKVIAERYDVSAPWVQGRKKMLGLVNSRAAS